MRRNGISPVKALIYIMAAIFCTELLIMFGLHQLLIEHPVFEMLLDATVLSAVLFPVLYLGIFQPLTRKNQALENAERGLRKAQHELEEKVLARTSDLQISNENMKRSLKVVEAQNRQMNMLAKIGQLLQTCRTPEEAYQVAADHLRHLYPDAPGALYLYRASRDSLERVVQWNVAAEFSDFFLPDDCWALRRASSHQNIPDRTSLGCRHYSVPKGARGVCLPLSANGETLGVLSMILSVADASGEDDYRLGQDDSPPILMAISESLALTIANIRFREALRYLAVRDELTGLYNRRFLDETIALELQRALRQTGPFSLIMLDIDHFKDFNDTQGHDAGDRVLSEIGRFMREHLRKGDIACRYGGEEFSVLMPKVEAKDAFERAEQLRRGIAALSIIYDGKPLGPVTMSCGIAAFPKHADDPTGLIRAADRALYRSKANGRNQSTLAETGGSSSGAQAEPQPQRLGEGP